MSKEADPDGSTSSSYFAMIKISFFRREKRDTTREKGDARRGGWRLRGERQMQVQPAPVQDGRTDVRADEGGIELWQRLLQGAGSGPGEADILLILYFFVCEGPAAGTVGHASPSVQLRSGLLFGIVARPHRHHGPSRSHLSHRVLAGIVDSTHLSRSRMLGQLQVFTFRASSVSLLHSFVFSSSSSFSLLASSSLFFFSSPLSFFIVGWNDPDDSLR